MPMRGCRRRLMASTLSLRVPKRWRRESRRSSRRERTLWAVAVEPPRPILKPYGRPLTDYESDPGASLPRSGHAVLERGGYLHGLLPALPRGDRVLEARACPPM